MLDIAQTQMILLSILKSLLANKIWDEILHKNKGKGRLACSRNVNPKVLAVWFLALLLF